VNLQADRDREAVLEHLTTKDEKGLFLLASAALYRFGLDEYLFAHLIARTVNNH
jgi:phosphosulfolactate phosphohydrolase-like enzyme